MKAAWPDPNATDGLCPGGCGKLHRRCCDSVLGEPHQSRCMLVYVRFDRGTRRPPLWRRVARYLFAW